jgi:uncharacterized membrane protein YhdT
MYRFLPYTTIKTDNQYIKNVWFALNILSADIIFIKYLTIVSKIIVADVQLSIFEVNIVL